MGKLDDENSMLCSSVFCAGGREGKCECDSKFDLIFLLRVSNHNLNHKIKDKIKT